jgi:predicted amidohydrolase YtcJ
MDMKRCLSVLTADRLVLAASLALALSLIVSASASYAKPEPADLVLEHGRIATMDLHQPKAQALAVRDHRIVAVGSDHDIKPYIGSKTKVIQLHGLFVTPGFIDSHAHFMELGKDQTELNLRSNHAATWHQVVEKVAQAVKQAKPGQWIIGYGWHQERWTHPPHPNVDGLPTGKALDRVSPNNPVLLRHSSGHAIFVNKKALELAGITKNTPNPPGGEIVKGKNGRPIGMLRDAAMAPVYQALRQYRANRTPEQKYQIALKHAELATRNALEHGVTTFQDMGESFDGIDFYKRIAREGKLHLRLYAWINSEAVSQLKAHLKDYYMVDYGKRGYLTVRGIGEITSDGALGTHSAWFFKPYNDMPSSTGINVVAMDKIRKMAKVAIEDGFQLSVHAIGTKANHKTLDVYQDVMAQHPDKTDLRWRIDHVQHLIPSDVPRFHELHVIAAMQAFHACNDGPYVIKRIGLERASYSYAWHSLIGNRTIIANGTDAPVVPIDVVPNFACAVTRRLINGKIFFPAQRMTRMEALRSYTYNGAYSMFKEAELGSLAPGKIADITIFDQDLLTVSDKEVPKTHVIYTIVGGKVMYHRGEGVVGMPDDD